MDDSTKDSGKCMSIEILGGLGNQLFQIAAVHIYNNNLIDKKRIVFKYEENLPNMHHLLRKTYWNSLFKDQYTVLNQEEYNKINWFNMYEFNPHINNIHLFSAFPHNILFKGYFQAFTYIDDSIREQLQDVIYSNKELVKTVTNLYNDIKSNFESAEDNDIVSLHIRRTDYVFSSTFHHNLSLDYYKQALTIADKKYVVVFSDDIEWCKENVNTSLYPFTNVHYVDIQNVELEFLLMSMIQHNIIANSTFSLWSSFISKHKDKIIVAPKTWYGPDGHKEWSQIYHKYITHII